MMGVVGPKDRWLAAARLFLMGALAFGFVWKAAAPPIPALVSSLAFALLAMASAFRRPAGRRAGRLFDAAVLLGAALAIVALVQALSVSGHPFAHPVWAQASALVGPLAGSISVAPAATLQAIPTAVAPFLLFACILAFCDDDRSATRLLRLLALLGGAFALFGLAQVTLLPGSLLLFEKTHYLGSLTGFWVNRNVAGALLGVASLAALVWVVDIAKGLDPARRAPLLRHERTFTVSSHHLVPAALVALCLVALFLTKSRGALMATAAAYATVLPLLFHDLAARRAPADGASWRARRGRTLAALLGGLLLVLLVVLLFGGLSSARLAQEGVDEGRLCFYRAAWGAFRAHPLLGTGLGTFDSVFPAFRQADCGPLAVSVSRAHNVYLQGLVELGLFFALFAVALIGALFAMLLAGYRSRVRRRHVPVAGLGVVVLLAVHGIVDFSLQIPGMALYVAAFLGAVGVIGTRRRALKPAPAFAQEGALPPV